MVEQPAGRHERLVRGWRSTRRCASAPTCSAIPIELIASNRLVAELAVVLQADLHLVADAGLADPLPGQLGLLPADRDADRVGAVAGCGVDHHRAPSAADVEQAHALALVEAELAGDEVVLRRLGLVERHVVVDEAGARVGHRLAEDDPVEVVADVVVMADRPRITAQRVAPALQPRLLRRRRQRPADHAGALAPRRSPRSPPCCGSADPRR